MARYVSKLSPLDPCPVEHVFALIGGKWKARVLHRLTLSDASLGDLQRHLPRAKPQVIKAQLEQMEVAGLATRLPREERRTWGRYAITDKGRSLHQALSSAAAWGTEEIGGWQVPTLDAA